MTAMDMMTRRVAMIGTGKPSRIPVEYQELDYIESDGTQCIDTGIVFADTRTIIEFMFTGAYSRDQFLCAGWGSVSNQRYYAAYLTSSKQFRFVTRSNSAKWSGPYYSTMGNIWHTVDYNNSAHEAWYDGVKKATNADFAIQTTNTNKLKLFSLGGSNQTAIGRIRSAKFENNANGEVLRNFVPCKRRSDGICGLFDLVSESFYMDSFGGNAFTPGPTV